MSIVPIEIICEGRAALYSGDGSERCVVCQSRELPSYYVGQQFMFTDEGLPERFPVCSIYHAYLWMEYLWRDASNTNRVLPMM